ncbi:MAG: alginate export family protein, partial [Bacteroidetes bacterium]|nr:alginate export family protein [Bacteroidota bacterium]
MKKFTFLFILLSLVFTDFVFSQDKVKIDAQIRPRFQYDNKDFNSNTGANTFTELRSRLGVLFSSAENLTGFFQIQDSRRFGSESSTLANSANLDLHQAYFSISNFFKLPLNLKVGRMELS